MTRAKTILLLDVDGVLNDFQTPDFDTGGRPVGLHLESFRANRYQIRFDPSIIARLRGMHDSGLVEIRWLTTWGAEADAVLADRMGLPTGLAVADADWLSAEAERFDNRMPAEMTLQERHTELRRMHRGLWWKGIVTRELLGSEPDVRVIWVDDDLPVYGGELGWAAEHLDSGRLMMVATQPSLSHADLDEIDEFADGPWGAA